MPKNNRKHKQQELSERRERQREYYRLRMDQQSIAQHAPLIKNQDQLNTILLQVKNRIMRGEVYAMIKPHLSFESIYPRHVAEPHSFE